MFVALTLLASAGAADEALVDAWMQRMSLVDKVGKMTQLDISEACVCEV